MARSSLLLVILSVLLFSAAGATQLDMTHPFNNESLFWPNSEGGFVLKILHRGLGETGFWYQTDAIHSAIHLGTHMDAPCHFYKDRWCVDQIPLERLVNRPAVMIDMRQRAARAADTQVSLRDVQQYEASYGEIARGAIVVQCSGWSDRYPDEAAVFGNDRKDVTDFHFPGFSAEAIKFLIEKRDIVAVAVDTPSIDNGQSYPHFPAHILYSSHNVYALENVKDTCLLPPVGATMTCLPSKIQGASGAATRAYATWDTASNRGASRQFSLLWLSVALLALILIQTNH